MLRLKIPEGYVINKWFASRFNRNKNVLIATIGVTGSGKSYANLRMLELWYEFYFKQPMPKENICFSIKEAMLLINSGKLPKGSILIVEEAGVSMNSLDFQNKIVKFFNFVLQSFRSKNIGIIFNLPNLGFMTKTGRTLLHGVFEAKKINTQTKEVSIKPFYVQIEAFSGKLYKHYLKQDIDGRKVKVKRVNYHLPSKDIIDYYEKKKDDFVNKVSNSLVLEIESKEESVEMPKVLFDKEKIIELCEQGYNSYKEMGKVLNIHPSNMDKRIKAIINEYNLSKTLKSLKNKGSNCIVEVLTNALN